MRCTGLDTHALPAGGMAPAVLIVYAPGAVPLCTYFANMTIGIGGTGGLASVLLLIASRPIAAVIMGGAGHMLGCALARLLGWTGGHGFILGVHTHFVHQAVIGILARVLALPLRAD